MKVTLYVPCYNGASWLEDCLASLVRQTRPADEILVVDDGSTDDSAAIVQRASGNVRLAQHGQNRGLAVARNTALAEARGEIVASVDADVRVTSNWLRRLLGAFDSPRTAAVGGKLIELHQERTADRWRAAHMAQHSGDFPLLNPPSLAGANVAVRRDVVKSVGGYEESFRTNYEDADLQHRLLAAGYRCRYEPNALAHHLRTDDARSVLRTFWGWLRPPFQREGAFVDPLALARKTRATAALVERFLRTDFAVAAADRSYLSLLVLLAFPLADLAHAARLAEAEARPEAASSFAAALAAVRAAIPTALASYSAKLASLIAADLERVDFWSAWFSRVATESSQEEGTVSILAAIRSGLAALPRTWWPAIEESRGKLAAEERWHESAPPEAPLDEVSVAPSGGIGRGAGQKLSPSWNGRERPVAPGKGRGTRSGRRCATDDLAELAAGLAQRRRDAVSVIGYGEHFAEPAPLGAPLRLLLVTLQAVPAADSQRWQEDVASRLGVPVELACDEAHRLGWLPPSVRQQQLVSTGMTLWGDESALRALPAWPPERLEPRLALDEIDSAERELGRGHPQFATALAAGALLVARRAYTPRPREVAQALRRVWPDAPPLDSAAPEAFVARTRALLTDWLFTWEGAGLAQAAQQRYAQLRQMAQAAVAQ